MVLAVLALLASTFILSQPVGAAAAPGGGRIINVASATYTPAGYSQTETVDSNPVEADVQIVEALTLTQDQTVTRPPNGQAILSHLLTNTGNATSSYTITFQNNGSGCTADTHDLSALKVVRDTNNNGVVDASDPVVALSSAGAITLQPGETAAILVQGGVPNAASGSACLVLSATTVLQGLVAANIDIVNLGDVAVVQLTKSAAYPGNIIPGTTRIDFMLVGTNTGAADAVPSSGLANGTGASTITVDGTVKSLVLIRDSIPAGTQYIPGSLQTYAPNAFKLYRLPGDPPFAYRTAEDASAIEVAIGLPTPLVRNGSVAVKFAVKVNADQSGTILNTGYSYYSDSIAPVVSPSNTVVLASSGAKLGLAKAASAPLFNRDNMGASDGTITTTFRIRVKNDGDAGLYDVQVADPIEGAGASQLGTYTTAAVPALGQYTIVAGSIHLAAAPTNGVIAAVNPGFTGQAGSASLLAAGSVLPVGAELTVVFDARINVTGKAGTLFNSAAGSAALVAGASPQVFDNSANGVDPDPDGDGNSGNNASPTPIPVTAPALTLVKTASLPRRVADGTYEIDYVFKVTNGGTTTAPFVRVIDNLDCTFDMDLASGSVASWALVGPVHSANGVLLPSSAYTGHGTCNRTALASGDPYLMPTEVALSLSDGSRSLAPGQSETLSITVQVTEKAAAVGTRVTLTNKAWAGSFNQNSINVTPTAIVAATSNSVLSLLADPQGTVYNSVSRAPIAGAVVTFSRDASCGPMTSADLYGGNSGTYTINADGSISMTTGADGAYQFYLQSPPVTGRCTYSLKVAPPAGSGYVYQSQVIPATVGTYSSCGAIVANAGPPQGGDATTYYLSENVGFNDDGSACEANHNHIPLDPGNINGLLLAKGGSKSQVEIGDFLEYALVLTNKTGFPVTGLTFRDILPAGFAYVPGTSSLNQATGPATTVGDPTGGAGPAVTWNFASLTLGIDQKVTLRYRVRVGVGSPKSGTAINRATASSGPLNSNLATYTVRLNGGVFSDEAFLFGKVYMACSAPGIDGHQVGSNDRAIGQDGDDAPGVPGVRLFLEDGTNVVTDSEGKWSLYGLKPVTHVLRIDQTTLPPGAKPELLDNRNAFDPQSRFVDLKNGEFQKANFPLTGCDVPEAMADVAARRKLALARPDAEGEAAVRTRLDPSGRIVPVSDARSLPSSGGTSMTGTASSQLAQAAPLISLPKGQADAGSFVGGIGMATGSVGTLAQAQNSSATVSSTTSRQAPVAAVGAQSPIGARPAPVGHAQGNASHSTSGMGSGGGTVSLSRTGPDDGSVSPLAPPILPQAAPDMVDLEALVPNLDNAPGFIGLKDNDTVESELINVRVKGQMGAALVLRVNGELQDTRRVGKKVKLASRDIGAWEYIGVQLKPGVNVLRLEPADDFGVARGEPVEIRIIAPGRLGALWLDAPRSARADGRTALEIRIRLTDADGVPVTARTQVTLEATAGRWVEEDLNPQERGIQLFVEGGVATYHLLPPGEPGNVRVAASTSTFSGEARIALLPEMRPMLGVGIVEGVLDFTNRGKLEVGQDPASAAFEQDLSRIGRADDHIRPGGRVAFYFKGTILGQYLLTAAADTDKSSRDRLFRDIRPDEFYPIYGDASARGFDAQSSQKVYVRIDKDRSYLLYGDFISASSPEVRQLSQSNRTLTGLKTVVDTGDVRATGYVARTSQVQQVEEFQGRGISGPYYLSGGGANATNSGGDFIENSETIEILVRDRNQPNVVLQRTAMTRFADYTIEPRTRRILFTRPIASLDANLNPQSIRVTYESESGGPKYTVAGADVQVRVADGLQLGVVATLDDTPDNKRQLGAMTVLARLNRNTILSAEVVRTQSDEKGASGAERIELRYQDRKLGVAMQAARSGANFDNPGSSFAAGRTEASARAELRISPKLQLRGEALYSKDNLASGETKGVTVSGQFKLTPTITAELGARYGSTTSSSASLFDYGQVSSYSGNVGTSVTGLGAAANAAANAQGAGTSDLITIRGRLTATLPWLRRAQVFIEGEQDVTEGDRHMLAVGGNYALSTKTRIYGRYEFNSSLGGAYDLSDYQGRNIGLLGIETNFLEGGRIYNEYRLANALDGATGQDAIGIRNTFKVGRNLRLTGGLEYVHMVGGHPQISGVVAGGATSGSAATTVLGQGDAFSFTSGVEYITPRFKASGILEGRFGDDSTTWLGSGGIGYKIDDDWSLLARVIYSGSKGKGANTGTERTMSRGQFGIAWRPVGDDTWNGLARYEHKVEVIRGGSSDVLVGVLSGSSFGNDALLPGTYITDIFSTHVNYNPEPGFQVRGRLAAKFSINDDGVIRSSNSVQLGQIRITHDINDRWDLGIQGAVMHGSGGAWQKSAGIEVGYLLTRNLWLSGGYNVIGLTDRDLTAGEYTSRGGYLRLRFKFGESALGFSSAGEVTPNPSPPIPSPPAPFIEPEPVALEQGMPNRTVISASELFDFRKSELTQAAQVTLSRLAANLRMEGSYSVVLVTGQADAIGPDGHDLKLSEDRANAVRDWLVAQGLDADRITTVGKGDDQPVAPNDRVSNRTVEIEVTGP